MTNPEKLSRVALCEFETDEKLTEIISSWDEYPDEPADAAAEVAIKYNLHIENGPALVAQFGKVADRYRENDL